MLLTNKNGCEQRYKQTTNTPYVAECRRDEVTKLTDYLLRDTALHWFTIKL